MAYKFVCWMDSFVQKGPLERSGLVFAYDPATWPTTLACSHNGTCVGGAYTSIRQLASGSISWGSQPVTSVLEEKYGLRYQTYSAPIAGCTIELRVKASEARGIYWEIKWQGNTSAYSSTRYFAKPWSEGDATPWGTITDVVSSSEYDPANYFTPPTYITLEA